MRSGWTTHRMPAAHLRRAQAAASRVAPLGVRRPPRTANTGCPGRLLRLQLVSMRRMTTQRCPANALRCSEAAAGPMNGPGWRGLGALLMGHHLSAALLALWTAQAPTAQQSPSPSLQVRGSKSMLRAAQSRLCWRHRRRHLSCANVQPARRSKQPGTFALARKWKWLRLNPITGLPRCGAIRWRGQGMGMRERAPTHTSSV